MSSCNAGIYQIRHKESGKIYIGSAIRFASRFVRHKAELNANRHKNTKLQRAWSLYGSDSFEFLPLLVCGKADLLYYEQLLIDGYDAVKSGYNICPTAGSPLGRKHSPESREKMRQRHKGKKLSPEHRAKVGLAGVGRRFTPESLAKRSATLKKIFADPDVRKRLCGKPMKDHVKEALRVGNAKKVITPEMRKRMSDAQKRYREANAVTLSAESREKISRRMTEIWRIRKMDKQQEEATT